MYKFFEYVKETKEDNMINLIVSKRFMNILEKMSSNKIKHELLNYLVSDVNGNGYKFDMKVDASFLDVTDKNDTISYILSSKASPIMSKYNLMGRDYEAINLCWLTNRQEQKLSRYINRIFKNKFTLQDVEDFVNNYKAAIVENNLIFEIVSGDGVVKYYDANTYSRGDGHLQHSCMRYSKCSDFLGIYKENPDKMNMLILKNNKSGKIEGRANIWFLDEPKDKIFMDRIYSTYEWQIKMFIDYAKKNNWMYKIRQVYGGSVIPLVVNGKEEKISISVNIKPIDYENFPYVDTLQFYNQKTGHLTSDVEVFKNDDYVALVLADGNVYKNQGGYKIDYLGRIVNEYFLRWSNIDKVYIHAHDAIYLDYLDDYATPNHRFIRINNRIYLEKDVEKDENGNYKIKKEN